MLSPYGGLSVTCCLKHFKSTRDCSTLDKKFSLSGGQVRKQINRDLTTMQMEQFKSTILRKQQDLTVKRPVYSSLTGVARHWPFSHSPYLPQKANSAEYRVRVSYTLTFKTAAISRISAKPIWWALCHMLP